MDYVIANKTKSPLINFYKAKLKKKELINKSNNIFGNQSNQKILKTFKREISNDKNKLGQMKYKTSKNSPNSSLVKYSNRGGQMDSNNISKKDIIINKISNNNNYISVSKNKNKNKIKNDLFEEFFRKKLIKINKNNNGQISQRQKSTKNIFNNLRNDSSLNSSRLTKIKKTIYGNSNIYFNNNSKIAQQINNSNIIEDNNKTKREKSSVNKNSALNSINNSSLIPSTSFRKIIVDNNGKKINNNNIFYNNFLSKQKGNNINNNCINNEKGYISNYNLMRHIENNDSNKNSINNKNKDDPFLKKYKNSSKSKMVESSSNSKIKKINPVDYLYNSKHKKENSKYAVKYLDENSNNSKKMKKNEPVSCEINGSYAEFNNKQNKTANISKNNTNKSSINKKRIKINEQKNENNKEENNNILNSDENKNKNEDNVKHNENNHNSNINDKSNDANINSYFNKGKKTKENLKNYLNKDNKSNIFNIKELSDMKNSNSLLSGNYLIKSSQLSSNHINNDINQEKNQDINSIFNNDMNNNSLLNISNNNNCNNINNQNININININNSSDNKNNNYINNNFIDINNYNKNIVPKYEIVNDSNSGIINNISSNVSHLHYLNNNSDIINNQKNEIQDNDKIYQKKISLIPKEFASSLNSNSKEEDIKNNNILNYNNYNHYNNNNQPNIIKAKLVKNYVQMNNFISPNKNINSSNNTSKINNNKDIDKNADADKDDKDMKINSMNTSKIKIFNDLQEQLCNSKNKDVNNTYAKENVKNKNIVIENDVYDINIIDINDFSPIYDEKCKNDNIQEKINKQNQLHMNKNNISLIDNKNILKNEYNFNSNNLNYNNINCIKNKINELNRDDLKNRQQFHKYSQSQSLGKKAKDLNKKIINNMNNIKIKNNIFLEKKVGENKSKVETKTNSGKGDTSNNNVNKDRDRDREKDKDRDKEKEKDKDKDKKNIRLVDLLDSKENSKEIMEKNKKENNTKDTKKNIFQQKIDIFSLKISNSENNNSNEKDEYKISELIKKNNNDDNEDMLYIPDSPEIRKKEQENIILTTMSKDCEYYKDEMEKLSYYIKNYFKENGKYPDSRIEFYLYGRQIGHGAFGKVNLALHIASGRLVAIKTFSKKHLKNKHAKQKIKNEIGILSRLRHPFINQILDSFETDKHIFIVMEYVCGDLLGFIRKRGKLSESISKLIFKQIIEGLKYIHKKKIVHRDIKLDNILIDLTNTVKICDFGVSRKLSNGDVMYEHCGTPAYIAPEIFGNKGYEGYLCDVWSAGVTLYYMLSGIQPFRANSIKDLENIVLQGKFEEIEEVTQEANDLIEEMLQVDPKKRITIDNILKHPWLKNVDLENRKNLNLFTQSEKILLSKFDVDYLISNKEELIENFSLKNLETNNNDTNFNVAGDTKSLIFAPYNSYIEESKDQINILSEEEKMYKELKINNNICKFGFKVQQANIKYELSNNNDFDNGVIKTQREEDIKNQNEKIEKKYEEKLLNDKLSGLNTPRVRSANDSFEESEKITINNDVIKKIEKEVGYDRKYIINCIKKNKINYATATYYLMTKDYFK